MWKSLDYGHEDCQFPCSPIWWQFWTPHLSLKPCRSLLGGVKSKRIKGL
jgi:hypothetical protein